MTGIAQAVRDATDLSPEEKLLRVCCLLDALDHEIDRVFSAHCPKYTQTVIGIVHAMSDDARNTLCVRPKCSGVLDKFIAQAHYKPPQNFLEPIMEIVFML